MRFVAALLILGLGLATATAQPETGPFIASEAEASDDDDPNRLRAGVEVGVTLVLAAIRYQLDGKRKKNWDFPSFKQRLTLEAWRFDNNPFGINYLWHAVEGTAFHLIARGNGMGLLESAAVGFGSSFAWEFVFEFKEKVSINDVLFTPAAGIVVGEVLHWLGRYLDGAPADAGLGRQIARYTLGAPASIHRVLDGRAPTSRSDIWHRFEFATTAATTSSSAMDTPETLVSSRAAARLVAIDGYRRPGRISRWFTNGNVSEASYELTFGGGGTGSRFRAESVLLGGYRQEIGEAGGRGGLVGVAMSYDYRREQLGDWQERLALLHLPGPVVDGELHGSDWTLAARARLHGDFGSVHAIAKDRWQMENPDLVGKTIVRKQGYTFGWGGSVRGDVELTTRWPLPLSIGGSLLAGSYNSDEGLDRTQETLTVDEPVSDTILELDAWLRVQPIAGGPHLELRASHQRHAATHDGLDASQRLTRLGAGLWLPF